MTMEYEWSVHKRVGKGGRAQRGGEEELGHPEEARPVLEVENIPVKKGV